MSMVFGKLSHSSLKYIITSLGGIQLSVHVFDTLVPFLVLSLFFNKYSFWI